MLEIISSNLLILEVRKVRDTETPDDLAMVS